MSLSFSIPMNFLFRFLLAIPVPPEPIVGSSTVSPSLVKYFIRYSMSGTGFCVACFPFSLLISNMLFGKGGSYLVRFNDLLIVPSLFLYLILSFSSPYKLSDSNVVSTTTFSSYMTLFGKGGS